MKNTTAILGKATILFAAAFFSAAAFAETCPKIEEIHLDQQSPAHWVTDSGWISVSDHYWTNKNINEYTYLEPIFYNYDDSATFIVPDHAVGKNVTCRYHTNKESSEVSEFSMTKGKNSLVVIGGNSNAPVNGNWKKVDGDWGYMCSTADKIDGGFIDDINACKFDVISMIKK